MTRPINLLTIHCSATASGKRLQRGLPGQPGFLNAAGVINAWHAERGFKRQPPEARAFNPALPSIGYHFVIDLDGSVLTGRGTAEVGAHAAGFNAHSLGICLVGGAEREGRYTPAQWQSLRDLVQRLALVHALPAGVWFLGPDAKKPRGILGHRDLSPDKDGDGKIDSGDWLKTCPGFDVRNWLARSMVPEARHVFVDGEAA